ncbi:MAG: thiamine pyrophosphate-binding protein [Salinarimonadaceae bacterium]|nr:MAG: thiamine pyrophosphate-binding protein [Salinarimonadaceae bacterium]
MPEMRLYRALADIFVKEEVDVIFTLTGDGNMHWEASYSENEGVKSYHVRHEHCACAMASAFASATGKVGVASVTCGPGLTQIMTALATAAQARIPLLVFVGETPLHAAWYNQAIDQAPLVRGAGAHYISAHSMKQVVAQMREAFLIARTQRRPVVIGVPLDMQQQMIEFEAYRPSMELVPDTGPRVPHPDYVARAVERIRAAKRVVVIGGRGAKASGAAAACAKLAELCGGALSETLPVRGLFTGNPRSIGLAGGFAHRATREAFEASDLVIAVGASLAQHTSDSNKLFSPRDVILIDDQPPPLKHGQKTAEFVLAGDARLTVETLVAALEAAGGHPGGDWDVAAYVRRVCEERADETPYEVPAGTIDPRDVVACLDKELPKSWRYVNASGHCSYFSAHIHGVPAERFLTIREFGAIGNGLSYAIGMAATAPKERVVLFDGDGGLMMHAQELETLRRYGIKMLLCIFNDGAFGSEIHKLRADKLSDHGAIYGRSDLAAMARGFGLRGAVVTDLEQVPALIKEFESGDTAMILDFHVSDQVMSPVMRGGTQR